MIDFATAWDHLDIGDQLTASNGAIEPADPESLDHRVWRSHNFSGVIAEKIDGEPRQMRIELPANEHGAVIGYLIDVFGGHCLETTTPTPALARDLRWEQAKAYRAERQCLPVPIPDIVPGEVIVADADAESRKLIEGFARGAMSAIIAGMPEAFELTFTDHNNQQFTVGAMQTVAIGNFMLSQFTLCHAASQAVRVDLDAALNAGGSAETILAIDITAGYPGDPAP